MPAKAHLSPSAGAAPAPPAAAHGTLATGAGTTRTRPPLRSWAAAAVAVLLPVLAGGASLAVSWGTWINPFVDSGREMDVPWRLAHGERLYHDITYYYGPLGPWLNAAALRLFGSHLVVLEALCLVLSCAIFALLYQVTLRAGGRLAAVTGTTLAAALCMGAPNGGAFIFPYSTSGLLALAGALLALWMVCLPSRGAWRALAAAGLAVALAARVEVGMAALLAVVVCGGRSRPRRETLRDALVVALAGSLLAGALYAVSMWGLDWRDLSRNGPLTHFAGTPPEWNKLYLHVAGLDAPWKTAGTLSLSLLIDGFLLAMLGLVALPRPGAAGRRAMSGAGPGATSPLLQEVSMRQVSLVAPALVDSLDHEALPAGAGGAAGGRLRQLVRRGTRALLFPALMLAVVVAYLESPYAEPFKNLPPFTVILPSLAALAACWLLRRPLAGRDRARFLLFAWSAGVAVRVVLGLAVGPKMGPYATLPLPGLLAAMAVLALDGLAPRLPQPAVFRRRLIAALAIAVAIFLYRLDRVEHRPHTAALATRDGTLWLPTREAAAIDHTLVYLERRAQPGDELTAFPESGFFNFLTGLRNPLRQDEMLPGVCDRASEAEAVARIERAGPRFVLLCNRPTSEYGPASFGADYYVALWQAVERHYALAASFGWARPTAPVGAGRFFIRVYERLPEPGVPALRLVDQPAPAAGGAIRQAAVGRTTPLALAAPARFAGFPPGARPTFLPPQP